jgi:hypothetical protein
MPDRPCPAVDNLIRRAQRVAAGQPDPAHILAQTIRMACPGGADPYAVLGLLIEGTVQTLVDHIPEERRAEIAAALRQLLKERLEVSGITDGDALPSDRPRPVFS